MRDERDIPVIPFTNDWIFCELAHFPKTIKDSHEAFSKTPQIHICISWYPQDFPKDCKSLTAKMRHGRGEVVHQFFRMSDWLRPDEQLDLIWPQATRTRKMKGENCRNADENEGSLLMPYLRTDRALLRLVSGGAEATSIIRVDVFSTLIGLRKMELSESLQADCAGVRQKDSPSCFLNFLAMQALQSAMQPKSSAENRLVLLHCDQVAQGEMKIVGCRYLRANSWYIYIYIIFFLCNLCNLRCLRATIVLQHWHWASSYIVARLSGRQGVAMVPWLAKGGWLVAVKIPRPMADSWRWGRMWIHCHHIAVVFAPLKRSSMVLLSCRSCRF